jgi:hypothetical protein
MQDQTSNRTVYGAYLQTCQLMGLPFVLKANTTLNEKLGIEATATLSANEMPRVRYFTIGNGGHDVKSAGGKNIPVALQHKPSDPVPFSMIPFVLRQIDDDLTPTQRERYGLRRTKVYNGVSYFEYYARRIDLTGVTAKMYYHDVNAGSTTKTEWVPDSTNLSPVPPDISNTGTNVASGDYLTASARISLMLDSFDLAEIINAVNIIYGDKDWAIISELGMCSGVDRVISTTTSGNSTINFNEVVGCQVHSHMKGIHLLQYVNSELGKSYDVGATEPLYL